jgi:hypothetical protein
MKHEEKVGKKARHHKSGKHHKGTEVLPKMLFGKSLSKKGGGKKGSK